MRKKQCIAMLLAGGQGSRLGLLTKTVAKPAAVSYTHLDVYKRQQLHFEQLQRVIALAQARPEIDFPAQAPTGALIAAQLQRAPGGLGQLRRAVGRDFVRRVQAVQAVSYTHLHGGIGSNSCGPRPMEKYLLKLTGPVTYTLTFLPYDRQAGDFLAKARRA